KKSTHFERANTCRAYAVDFAVKLGSLDNNEPFKDALENELSLHFPETILLFLTREDFFLRRHTAIGLTGEILAHLEVNLVDSVIEKVKQGATTLTPQDFEASEPLAFLAKYRQVIAHKILHRQEFIALAFIIESDNEKVGALKQMMHTYALQNHISRLRDHATSVLEHADNPIMAIRNFIAACEQNLAKAQEPYAIIVTNIANYTRLHNLYGDALAAEIRDFTRKTLREIMEAQDFATEAYHGHFVSILRQKEAGDAWRLSRVLQKQAGKAYADEDRRPLFQHKIYARPHLSVIPFEMLFKS
ncbi:MAG TPA: hypothetical protein PLY93_14515, partial [Turneriella sp.]|nr:hypothetical protein [Turneriella sp.]